MRSFSIGSLYCSESLEQKLSLSAMATVPTSLIPPPAVAPTNTDLPLPEPEPDPGPFPGDDPPIIYPDLPPSGPVGPG